MEQLQHLPLEPARSGHKPTPAQNQLVVQAAACIQVIALGATMTTSRLAMHLWGEMDTSRVAAGIALLALMLTACSGPQPQAAPTASVAPAWAPSARPTPNEGAAGNENERGQVVQEIGETAVLVTDGYDAPPTMTFKVTSIEPVKCDARNAPRPHGIAIAVALEIVTTLSFSGPLVVNGQPGMISFRPHYWKGYASNGTQMNTVESSIEHGCLADRTKLLPDYFGKDRKLNGLVILDVTTPTGQVAFVPNGIGGWVWEYPGDVSGTRIGPA